MDLESAQGTTVDGVELSEPNEFRKAVDNGSEIVFGASSRRYIVRGYNQAPAISSGASSSSLADMAQLPTGFATTNNVKQSQKAADRAARDEEIRRMTMEMMTQAPKVSHVPAVSADEVGNTTHEVDNQKPRSSVPRGPQNNPNKQQQPTETVDSDGPESDSDDDDNAATSADSYARDLALRYNLPLKNQVVLTSHTKSITSIAVDAPGARVATGSMDYHMKLWDFAGMARQVRPFRDTEVEEGHAIVALSYSPTGDRVLSVTGSSQPTVLSREGVKETQFVKGDMYVMDMVHTKGHTHTCTGGAWHPTLKQSMATCALDGTVRLWKLDGKTAFNKLLNDQVIKFKSKQGKRIEVTACAYNTDGSLVFGATTEGSVFGYDLRRATTTTAAVKMPGAHAAGSPDLSVFVGSSAGTVRVFYDEAISTKGVLLSATKKLPLASAGYVRIDESSDGAIVNPHALPMYRDANAKPTKRKYAKIRLDPIASKKPSKPITGPGFGGSTGGSTLTQFFMRDQIKSESIRSEDPREAILKYAKVAAADSTYLGSAYATTQPTDQIAAEYQLAKETLEQEKLTKEEQNRRLLDL
ncbi:hypothetical protein DYB30_000470 [Aphanomyces astaci]|uniref:Uncharacterized protein n=1 Tax=Aphanomyces astaci TaxID=112090 RepID=A0A397C9A6_APHAT|nr:hypothetical protein DYB30_000470 [Aphanomyces astaci]